MKFNFVLFLWWLHATLRCMHYCSQASKCPSKRFKPSFFHFYSGYKQNMLKCVLNCRDDDSDDEIDDQDIHKIMIVTQTPPPVKKHDRTGNYVTRVKMTQELSKAINDGLYYYEQVWKICFSLNGNWVVMFPTRDATEILVGASCYLPVQGTKVKVVALTQCNNSQLLWCDMLSSCKFYCCHFLLSLLRLVESV